MSMRSGIIFSYKLDESGGKKIQKSDIKTHVHK